MHKWKNLLTRFSKEKLASINELVQRETLELNELSAALNKLIVDTLPHCHGKQISGHGSNQVWTNDCGKIATMLDKSPLGTPWSGLCDEHYAAATEYERVNKFNKEAPWAASVRVVADEYSEQKVDDDDALMTLEEFEEAVECGSFIDDDGCGELSDGKVKWAHRTVNPSHIGSNYYNLMLLRNPKPTHIVWYNK